MELKTIFIVCIVIFTSVCIGVGDALRDWFQAEDGHEYFIETENNYEWHKASAECKRRGLRLVEIESAAKNKALDTLLRSAFGNSLPSLWIGATDLEVITEKNRPFYWSTTGRRVKFADWSIHQPDNYKGNEHCLHLYAPYNLKWNDAPCTMKQGFICEERFISS
ncbi:lectin subunit alpha-like [Musca vetustissima]|uniref:lectin subunit alpha-like n=1 Tax=Musca vetustissima TaxID=27455 RepID=UPI002AB5F3C2|nr:lectin subunit alpha-like [Musca vetustissima]